MTKFSYNHRVTRKSGSIVLENHSASFFSHYSCWAIWALTVMCCIFILHLFRKPSWSSLWGTYNMKEIIFKWGGGSWNKKKIKGKKIRIKPILIIYMPADLRHGLRLTTHFILNFLIHSGKNPHLLHASIWLHFFYKGSVYLYSREAQIFMVLKPAIGFIKKILFFKMCFTGPDPCGSLVGHCSAKQKAAGSIPSQGHAWVAGLVPGACMTDNQMMFLSHITITLHLFLPPFPSL